MNFLLPRWPHRQCARQCAALRATVLHCQRPTISCRCRPPSPAAHQLPQRSNPPSSSAPGTAVVQPFAWTLVCDCIYTAQPSVPLNSCSRLVANLQQSGRRVCGGWLALVAAASASVARSSALLAARNSTASASRAPARCLCRRRGGTHRCDVRGAPSV
jgi:hypothetical protein